jgi:hypothetical protein
MDQKIYFNIIAKNLLNALIRTGHALILNIPVICYCYQCYNT